MNIRGKAWYKQMTSQLLSYHSHGMCIPGLSIRHVKFNKGGDIDLNVFDILRPIETDEQGLVHNENEISPSVLPFTAPEVFRGDHYDPKLRDHWAVSCVLIFLLTETPLYEIPHESNRNFNHFVIKGGISPVAVAALAQADRDLLEEMSPIYGKIQNVDPELLSLLCKTLGFDPSQRLGITDPS